jgi:hypothetical protein
VGGPPRRVLAATRALNEALALPKRRRVKLGPLPIGTTGRPNPSDEAQRGAPGRAVVPRVAALRGAISHALRPLVDTSVPPLEATRDLRRGQGAHLAPVIRHEARVRETPGPRPARSDLLARATPREDRATATPATHDHPVRIARIPRGPLAVSVREPDRIDRHDLVTVLPHR